MGRNDDGQISLDEALDMADIALRSERGTQGGRMDVGAVPSLAELREHGLPDGVTMTAAKDNLGEMYDYGDSELLFHHPDETDHVLAEPTHDWPIRVREYDAAKRKKAEEDGDCIALRMVSAIAVIALAAGFGLKAANMRAGAEYSFLIALCAAAAVVWFLTDIIPSRRRERKMPDVTGCCVSGYDISPRTARRAYGSCR